MQSISWWPIQELECHIFSSHLSIVYAGFVACCWIAPQDRSFVISIIFLVHRPTNSRVVFPFHWSPFCSHLLVTHCVPWPVLRAEVDVRVFCFPAGHRDLRHGNEEAVKLRAGTLRDFFGSQCEQQTQLRNSQDGLFGQLIVNYYSKLYYAMVE